MTEAIKYVLVTPVRDEEEHIEGTIRSVASQSILPAEWVIVNDGSKDSTGAIINRYAAQYSWITPVHRADRGFRKSGGGVVDAFNEGYEELRCRDWDFVVKLDGDLTFAPDYFECCFRYFQQEPKLGIGGGDIYHHLGGEMKREENPKFHVRGATKIYRRRCFEAIGGLFAAPGWDTIDEVKANMLGWNSRTFTDLQLHHHRLTGSADGQVRDRIKHGVACYVSGYHPLFVVVKCFYRLIQKPYLVGSVAVLYGFLKGSFAKMPRVEDPQFIDYIRAQQLRRLCGLETIWK